MAQTATLLCVGTTITQMGRSVDYQEDDNDDDIDDKNNDNNDDKNNDNNDDIDEADDDEYKGALRLGLGIGDINRRVVVLKNHL